MNNSILDDIKKLLGIPLDDPSFDQDIIIHINSVFMILQQLGIGPEEGYSISSKDNVWSEFIDKPHKYEMVKSYIYLKVRLMFDPPQIGSLIDSTKQLIAELEWRLNHIYEIDNITNERIGHERTT